MWGVVQIQEIMTLFKLQELTDAYKILVKMSKWGIRNEREQRVAISKKLSWIGLDILRARLRHVASAAVVWPCHNRLS